MYLVCKGCTGDYFSISIYEQNCLTYLITIKYDKGYYSEILVLKQKDGSQWYLANKKTFPNDTFLKIISLKCFNSHENNMNY